MTKDAKRQPFHESILAAISRVRTRKKLMVYLKLIIATNVPAGQHKIIEALRQKARVFDVGNMLELKQAIYWLQVQEQERADKVKHNPKNLLFPGPFMEKGSTGAAVAFLQALLKTLYANPKIEIDGNFGAETARGLIVLQNAYKIGADGKCGPATRKEIYKRTGIDLNALSAALFKKETTTVPPEPWA